MSKSEHTTLSWCKDSGKTGYESMEEIVAGEKSVSEKLTDIEEC